MYTLNPLNRVTVSLSRGSNGRYTAVDGHLGMEHAAAGVLLDGCLVSDNYVAAHVLYKATD